VNRGHLQRKWSCLLVELPVAEYERVWRLQTRLVAARRNGILDCDAILLTEHQPVFTLGRRGGLDNLIASVACLDEVGVPLFQVERGGSITYHGPGQLVVYPIIDLVSAGLKVVDYVGKLEEVAIRTAAAWGIDAERNAANRGVWVGARKLASVGIAVRQGISFHGIALNVSLSLEPFRWIHPCGLHGVEVTSMERELSYTVPAAEVRRTMKGEIETVFGVELLAQDLYALETLLPAEELHG
jgi:lipoyl(octanoyl) transferase